MRRTITLVSVLLLASTLTACKDSKADPAACEKAMRQQLTSATENPGGTPASRPPECAGVSDKQLEEIATKILAGN